MAEVSKINEYGDQLDLAFVGLLIGEPHTVYCYLRCTKHSKRIQVDQIIAKHVQRNTKPTDEEKALIFDLLEQAQTEGHTKNFVVGSQLDPGKGGDTVIFKEERGQIYFYVDGPIRGNRSYNLAWLLNLVHKQTDPYANWESFLKVLHNLVSMYPEKLKWITALNEDWFGQYA